MAIYQFRCDHCNREFEEEQPLLDQHLKAPCQCGEQARRVWTPVHFSVAFRDGWDVGLGEYVDTKRQRDQLVRDKNLTHQQERVQMLNATKIKREPKGGAASKETIEKEMAVA